MQEVLRKWPLVAAIVGGVLILAVPPAGAIDFVSASGTWNDVVGGDPTNISGEGTNVLSWGADLGNGQSSLSFLDGSFGVSGLVAGDIFGVGLLFHHNVTIGLPAPTAADLAITLDFESPDLNPLLPDLTFAINETPNGGPCPVGAPPCADIIGLPPGLGPFDIGDGLQLTILGFATDPTGPFLTEFISEEDGDNRAILFAQLSERPPVPEPGIALLLGTGLLGLALWGRRTHKPAA